MTAFLIIGGIACAWALLAVVGGERQQRLNRAKYDQLMAKASAKPADPQKSVR